MSYATSADLIARKDARTVGQLASDDNSIVQVADMAANTNILAALADASGQVEAAILVGARYSTTDLAGLTGNSQSYLKRLVCDIAFAMLWQRRSYLDNDKAEQAIEASMKAIGKLQSGENIFNLPAVVDATLPEITGISSVRFDQLNTISGRCRGKFYPGLRLPDNR